MNSKQTYEKLLPIFAAMDKSVICQSVVDNLDGTYTFDCDRTRWACKGYDISILGNDYTITNVVYNTSITVSGNTLPLALTFDLYAGFFKHGTIRVVANELLKTPAYKDRLPLTFLHEVVNETIHFDPLDALENESDVRIFFLIDCDFKNWSQLDGDTLAIAPMRCFANEFIKCLSNSQYITPLKSTGIIRSYNIFGNADDNGVSKNIFNEFLSGVELKITIPFLRDCDCCTENELDNRPAPGYVLDSDGNILAVLYSNEYYTVTASGGNVNILDQDDNIIDTVAAPGDYHVTVLSGIQDTIDANTSTIIENLT